MFYAAKFDNGSDYRDSGFIGGNCYETLESALEFIDSRIGRDEVWGIGTNKTQDETIENITIIVYSGEVFKKEAQS